MRVDELRDVVDAGATSEGRTISISSTQTPSLASRGRHGVAGNGPSPNTPTVNDVVGQSNLSSRAQTKLKKIKKKYAGQDDEDRQRAMALLGNNVSKVHQVLLQAEVQAKADDDADDDDANQTTRSTGGRVRFAADQEDASGGSSGDEGGRGSNNESFAAMEREHEAMNRRASSFEDETAQIASRMADEFEKIVPFLDGCPALEDAAVDVEDAMIVCAPYAAIRHFTFKARIAPGTEKKGQAARGLLDAFTKQVSQSMPRAANALKALSNDDVIAQLAGPLKVHYGDIQAPVTGGGNASSPAGPSPSTGGRNAAAGGEDEKLSVRQKQKLKKEEQERQMMEKLREERRARLAARERKQQAHADPAAGSPAVVA